MGTSRKIFPFDLSSRSTEEPLSLNSHSEVMCFYPFTGGNASETENLTKQLIELKEENSLLIGIFRFPFRFEGKKRLQTAATQYFRMKEICDAVIYFHSDTLLETLDTNTTIREASLSFQAVEEYTIHLLRQMVEEAGDVNIDFQDIKAFVENYKGPLFIHTVEGESFDEPLKYLFSTPYLPEDFTDAKQLIVNIGYTREVDMEAFRQINLRLHDLFSKADLFKIGSYYIDEPGQRFQIALLVNGIQDPINIPQDYKRLSKSKSLLRKWQRLSEKGKKRLELFKNQR